ncbi:MAG: TrmH family RNA methyltransferase [Patescibacteria group bacterium]
MVTKTKKFCLILHNLRGAHNVGAIFRLADAIGAEKIFLTGYTPRPIDRYGRINKKVAKTALGAERLVTWSGLTRPGSLFATLRRDGYQLVALEQSARSVDYKKFLPTERAALIIGNELRGVDPAILKQCDTIVEIPMRGGKESLNVVVATAVALFRWFDR